MTTFYKQLITGDDNVTVEMHRFWYNTACLVGTVIVLYYAWHLKLDALVFIVYMGCVGGFECINAYFASKGVLNGSTGSNQPNPGAKDRPVVLAD